MSGFHLSIIQHSRSRVKRIITVIWVIRVIRVIVVIGLVRFIRAFWDIRVPMVIRVI